MDMFLDYIPEGEAKINREDGTIKIQKVLEIVIPNGFVSLVACQMNVGTPPS